MSQWVESGKALKDYMGKEHDQIFIFKDLCSEGNTYYRVIVNTR